VDTVLWEKGDLEQQSSNGTLAVSFGDIDLAIIFLMVSKPGQAGSVAVAGTGLALGRPWPPWRRGGSGSPSRRTWQPSSPTGRSTFTAPAATPHPSGRTSRCS